MAVMSNLYPPILKTYTPAFTINPSAAQTACKIYFDLSPYTSRTQISNAQVTVRNQNTNLSALNPNTYPTEVMILHIKENSDSSINEKYYIEIYPEDMINGEFVIDQFYKVQIRFTDVSKQTEITFPDNIHSYSPTAAWLMNNLTHFSEWSTITLIKCISLPLIQLIGYAEGGVTDIPPYVNHVSISGQLTFADEDETETLKCYRVSLFPPGSNIFTTIPIMVSEWIYTSNLVNPNAIDYEIDYEFQQAGQYTFTIEIITLSGYEYTARFNFSVQSSQEENPCNTSLRFKEDSENGRNMFKIIWPATQDSERKDMDEDGYINIKHQDPEEENGENNNEESNLNNLNEGHNSNDNPPFSGTGRIVIRRADNKDNFTAWNDLYFFSFNGAQSIEEKWEDYTIESGIWYKYGIQEINENGQRSQMKFMDPVMQLFDDAFLTISGKQLKIKFNPQVSSFKQIISESKTETIGSKYPFIKRNAEIGYKQFPLSGLISSAMDETGLFTDKEIIYQNENILSLYDTFNKNNNIPVWRDFIYEKFFRDKVMDFLHADNIKLFRSPTEGNILVKLMDINFQPNQTLGRMLYSFSGTAYEIDACNLINFEKYGILVKGEKPVITGTTYVPVQRIFVITTPDQFPQPGETDVLYVYERQLYIWSAEQECYLLISIPFWNEDTPAPIEIDPGETSLLFHQGLYTNGTNVLYQYNGQTHTMNPISEPTFNQIFFESGE